MDHTVVHFEIPADEPGRAADFYGELFGWEVQHMEAPAGGGHQGGYWMISTVPTDEQGRPSRPGVNGGIMHRMHPQHAPVHYVGVESVDSFAKKAEALGGQVVVAKTPVPGMGWFALVKDTEGNVFGLWQNEDRGA